MKDIPGYEGFIKIDPIDKGWSSDQKYLVETASGERMLLRVSGAAEYAQRQAEYQLIEKMHCGGVLTSRPIDFGRCGEGAYSLSGWIDGQDLEAALPGMAETEQYAAGLKAGEALKRLHSIPVNPSPEDWRERYSKVIDERIQAYRIKGEPFEGSGVILEYLENNRALLAGRPQSFIHGDFHEGNLMLGADNGLYAIDPLDEGFGNTGDPWYDFKTFGENDNAYFSTGLVRGYFGGEPPSGFWEVLTYYIVAAALTSIVWLKYNREEELPEALKWNERNARAIREGRSPLEKWHLKDFYIQWQDGLPYKLKSPFDFSFLAKYGRVFKIYDDQDSGNICFGVEKDGVRYFIKFAGAPTARAGVSAGEAIENLARTPSIYRDLAHPNLIKLLDAGEIGGGYALIFEWVDAECMHPMYPLSRERFMTMPLGTRFQVYEEILDFHAHAARTGYVAIDFYDGSIMYDFGNERTVICDIDLYAKAPYINGMGRMWGSSRFMSPEEFKLSAAIDEVTNVYTMGATAFALFGDERDRVIGKWRAGDELFAVAERAVSEDRSLRQRSIAQLAEEWRAAR